MATTLVAALLSSGLVLPPLRAVVPTASRAIAPRACADADAGADADDGWTTTASGLRFVDEVVGSGESPEAGQTVKVAYTGTLVDGSEVRARAASHPRRDRTLCAECAVGAAAHICAGWHFGSLIAPWVGRRSRSRSARAR